MLYSSESKRKPAFAKATDVRRPVPAVVHDHRPPQKMSDCVCCFFLVQIIRYSIPVNVLFIQVIPEVSDSRRTADLLLFPHGARGGGVPIE
jgi:hypothetical protein